MKYTPSEASKLLRTLKDEHEALERRERQTREFTAAIQEDIESVRPVYDYQQTQEKLKELEEKIRRVKHAVNRFNLETEVPGFGMTIDQMLIYLPQLNDRKSRLGEMKDRLSKERIRAVGYSNNYLIEYNYANYDIEAAERDYRQVSEELVRAQTALDLINSTAAIDIE